MSNTMPINPAMQGLSGGKSVNMSCNVQAALALIMDYLRSTYDVQAADTQLENAISNAEATMTQQFEGSLNWAQTASDPIYLPNEGSDILWQLTNIDKLWNNDGTPMSDEQREDAIKTLTELYNDESMKNSAAVKVMDGNNSTAQNTISQNAQGPSGLIQTMSALNGIGANLVRILQG